MKRNHLISVLCLCACTLGLSQINFSNAKVEAYGTSEGYAEYVSVDNAPIIDGEIDDVWELGFSLVQTSESDQHSYGIVDILWNETGLYFLAKVTDLTLNNSDLCNFWVSETYYETKNYQTYPKVDGAYYLCLNCEGENAFYKPDSFGDSYIDVKYNVGAVKTEDGYIIELYVPLTGNNPLKEGASIGFDVSVDDYLTEGTSIEDRYSYVYWGGLGKYWEYPSHLGKVLLTDYYASNGSPEKTNESIESGDSQDSQEKNSSSIDESDNSENNENSDRDATGCFSGVNFGGMGTFLLGSAVFLMGKKKRKNK